MSKFSSVFNRTMNSAKNTKNSVSRGLNNFKNGFTGKGRTGYFKATQKWNRSHAKKGGYAGGWAAIAFGNIINAHSSPEEIVDTFELDKDQNEYGCDAYERAYTEQRDIAEMIYQEWCDYYMGIIEDLTIEMNNCLSEAELLEQEAQALQDEAEGLRDEAEFCEDPDEMMELMDEAQALEQEAQELLEQAEALRTEAADLEAMIDGYYSEMELLSVEEFIDTDEVEKNAFEYACEFAQEWIDGSVWIDPSVLSWAFYEVSDHNG